MTPCVIALDPGGTTGWAELNENQEFSCGFFGPQFHHASLNREFCMAFVAYGAVPGLHIVTESFEFRNQHRDNVELVSVEYIGIARLFAEEHEITFVEQTASQGKVVDRKNSGFVTPANLQALGLWKTPQKIWKHSMDAYGHLLYYIIHTNPAAFGELPMTLLQKGWK